MDLGSLLIIFALIIVVAGYIALPILEKRGVSITEGSRYASELKAERDQVLMNLQELDMDHTMGKIPTEEYQRRRPALLTRGAAILKELDRLAGIQVTPSPEGDEPQDLQDQGLETQIEEEILRRRKKPREQGGVYCPQCGNKLHAEDRFCTSCGSKVHVTEAEA